MNKNLNEIVIDKENFTVDDARAALEQIFSSQVDDFNSIKNEKWYKKLLNAVTFGAGRKKLVIKDIRSLSKLQAILALICTKGFQDTDAHIEKIIENLSKTNEAVKKIYLSSVVGIKPQEDIKKMSETDKLILLLTLEQYKSINGKEEDFKEYITYVARTMGISLPETEFNCELLSKVNSVEVVFRCLVELQMIDGTEAMPELISEAVDNLNISTKAKKKIYDTVSREIDTFKPDYLIKKYSNSYGEIDAADLLDDESNDIVIEEECDSDDLKCSNDSKAVSLSEIADVIEKEYNWTKHGNARNPVYQIEILKNQDINTIIDNNEINNTVISDSIKKSLNKEGGFAYLYRLQNGDMYDEHFDGNPVFMALTVDGVYICVAEQTAYIDYNSLKDVKQKLITEIEYGIKEYYSSLIINADKIVWYSNDGNIVDGDDNVELDRIDRFFENPSSIRDIERFNIRYLRRFFEKILFVLNGNNRNTNDLVEEIVDRYLKKIAGTYNSYVIKSINDYKDKNRKNNAMSKYPGLRDEDVIAFIDTTVFKTGKEGILFGYEGIGFDYAFKRVFVKYSEITEVDCLAHVTVRGFFDNTYLSYIEGHYEIIEPINKLALTDCLEEILCII